jgi:transposase
MVTGRAQTRRDELKIVKRATAMEMVRSGKSRREVAKKLRMSYDWVCDTINRVTRHKRYSDTPPSGRPKKFTRVVTKKVVALARNPNYGSVRSIQQKLAGQNTKIAISSVHRLLRRSGHRFYVRPKKPKLTAAQRTARLEWARRMMNASTAAIHRLVFADEKRFSVGSTSIGVWRLPTEERPVRETVKFPYTVMVSGVITSNGVSSLLRLTREVKLTGAEYLDILKKDHIPLTRKVMRNQPFTFIHDHASVHDCKVVDDWLATQDFGRDQTFPSHSPDLNLIENIWGLMAQGMTRRNIETPEDLDKAIKEEWELVSPTVIQRMYLKFKDRLQAVIDANGGPH